MQKVRYFICWEMTASYTVKQSHMHFAKMQGDDYILYCHPHRQKTPRSDRLREWYHMLLRQAKSEGIVTYLSNLYDTFFEGGKDHRVEKPSVLHLPYFEGIQTVALECICDLFMIGNQLCQPCTATKCAVLEPCSSFLLAAAQL